MAAPGASMPLAGPASATWRDELAALIRLAGPLVAANLLQMAVYAVDVMFVSRLGPVPFAAATLAVFLLSLIMWALLGFTGACAPVIAAELGRRAHAVREVRRSFRMAMWLGAGSSLVFMAVLWHGERILLAFGQDPEVSRQAGGFLRILLWVMLPNVFAGIMRTVAAALGRHWLLVFGNAGFPALGLAGSAIASCVTATAMMLAWTAILLFDPKLRRYRLFGRWWRSDWARLREIARLGGPIALTFTLEGALFGGAAFLMGLISVASVDAHAVALNIAAIAFQVPYGIAQAGTIRVGMAYGARDHRWIARAGWTSIALGTGFMLTTAVAIWLVPRLFIAAYIDIDDPAHAEVVVLAVQFLALAAMFQLFDGAQAVAAGALRGLQDTRVPMLIAGFGYWVAGFGAAIWLGFGAGWQGVGIWTGLLVGLFVVSGLLIWRWAGRERLGLLPA
jgi:Na+-driven multidrug efflux pump